MKVIEIYDKNSNIQDHKKNIFKTMDAYFGNFPVSYRECYDKNLETLEILKVDAIDDGLETGEYNPNSNNIIYSKNFSLGHELIHMATNDMEKRQFAFESKMAIENGLIEGMTEYHHMKAYNLKTPGAYYFEVFVVTMMEDIPDLFESFFVPKEKGIFNICSDKRIIYSLMYSLDECSNVMLDFLEAQYTDNDILIDNAAARKSIRHTLDSLLSLELSLESDRRKLNEYGDKFMDLINSKLPGDIVGALYPNYKTYAENQIKKRIRSK